MSTLPKSFKPKALPSSFKPKAAEGPSASRAGIIAGTQGLTGGFADEIGAGIGQFFLRESGVKPGAAAAPSPDDSPEVAAAKAQLNAEQPSRYDLIRGGMREEDKAAQAAHGDIYNTLETGGQIVQAFNPIAKLAGGVGTASKIAQKAAPAVLGGLNALGHAEGSAGEQALQAAGGAVLGKAVDKGLGFVGNKLKGATKFVDGKKFQSLSKWFKEKAQGADDAILAAAEKSKEKAVESARGSLGGEAAGIIRSRDVAKQAAEELANVNPELAAKLREAADSPEALARLQGAAENYLPRLKEGLESFAEKGTELAAAKARDPAAEAATRGVKDVFLSDRSKKWYGGEAIRKGAPIAGYLAGDLLGGEEDGAAKTVGTAGGILAALMTGGRGSKVINDLRSPEVVRALSKGGQKLAQGLGTFAESLARPALLEATDDPEKFQALAEWLRRGQ